MLKKRLYPSSNNSENIITIIKGAKRRRTLAYNAVKAVNNENIQRPNLFSVK